MLLYIIITIFVVIGFLILMIQNKLNLENFVNDERIMLVIYKEKVFRGHKISTVVNFQNFQTPIIISQLQPLLEDLVKQEKEKKYGKNMYNVQ